LLLPLSDFIADSWTDDSGLVDVAPGTPVREATELEAAHSRGGSDTAAFVDLEPHPAADAHCSVTSSTDGEIVARAAIESLSIKHRGDTAPQHALPSAEIRPQASLLLLEDPASNAFRFE
jgi:hypothetical protein